MSIYRLRRSAAAAIVGSTLIIVGSCVHPPFTQKQSVVGYPVLIERIIISECATTGCHDAESKDAAGGLDLSTWEHAMQGGRNNASIIPYSTQQSPLLFAVNTFEDMGPTLSPTMPYGSDPLNRVQVQQISDWIARGAPSAEGEIAFEHTPASQRLFILNSLCRQIAVIDLETGTTMRFVQLDTAKSTGFAERILVHPTKEYWYVLYTNGLIEQHDLLSGDLVGEAQLAQGSWRTLELNTTSDQLYVVNWLGNSDLEGGQLAKVNAESMQVSEVLSFEGDSVYFPIGLACNEDESHCYTTSYLGNFIYRMNLSAPTPEVSLVPLGEDPIVFNTSTFRPVDVVFDHASQSYFIASERSEDVRRFSKSNDSLEAIIPVGFFPQQMVIDPHRNHLFVTCMEDVETFPGSKGAVYVIDLATNEVVETIYSGYQPRGMYLDDVRNWLYVTNRNVDPVGADVPHHYTDCEGNNGYLTRIDLNSLTLDREYKAELSVDPYDVSGR